MSAKVHLRADIKINGKFVGSTAYCAGCDIKPWALAETTSLVTCEKCLATLRRVERKEKL